MTIICEVCQTALEGMWGAKRTARVATWEGIDEDLKAKLYPRKDAQLDTTEWKHPQFLYGFNRDKELISEWPFCGMCELRPLTRKKSGSGLSTTDFGFDIVFFVAWSREAETWKPTITCFNAGVTSIRQLSFMRKEDHRNLNRLDIGSSTNDDSAWQQMDKWMETCISTHGPCNRASSAAASYRPTRLLKLGPDHTWHLEERQETLVGSAKYAALSYCWGKKSPETLLRLLESNQAEFCRENSQSTNDLPKTFQESIKVVRHFGLEYLWIDRLCICQDSSKDWEHEAGHMRDVYHHAYLHIAALGAEDSDSGLFFDRRPAKLLPSVVNLRITEDGEDTEFIVGPQGPHRSEPYRSAYFKPYFRGPILDRSWVVQERLLSKRTLYFGHHQLYWECKDRHCCEIVPQGIAADDYGFEHPDQSDSRDRKNEQAPTTNDLLSPRDTLQWKQLIDGYGWGLQPSEDPLEQLYAGWSEILRNYSNKSITYPRDKLVALSGIAREMESSLRAAQPAKEHRYLAGMWEGDLMMSLPWTAKGRGRRPAEYRAPSWSWAAYDVRLSNVRLKSGAHVCAILVGAAVVPKTGDFMGEIESATLTMAGPCGMADLELSNSTNGKVLAFRGSDGEDITNGFSAGRVYLDTDIKEGRMLDCMWIAIDWYGTKWRGHGLLLHDANDGHFQRLGVVNCDFVSKEAAIEFIAQFRIRQLTLN